MFYFTFVAIAGLIVGFILGVLLMMDTAMRTVRRKRQEQERQMNLAMQEAARADMEHISNQVAGKTPQELKAMGFDLNITETKGKS